MAESVKSADRVLQVIELLTAESRGLTYTEIRDRLELPKSSAHALLGTMTVRGFLSFDEATRRYGIGLRLWQAGQRYLAATSLEQSAQPYLQAVCDALQETVQLAVLDGMENVYIAKVDSTQPLRLESRVGARLPAYATGIGKALLFGMTAEQIRQLFHGVEFTQFTSTTVADVEALITVVAEARERGYATDDAEHTPGVNCIAMPVYDRHGAVCAALSVAVPGVRMSPGFSAKIIKVLSEQATALSTALGAPTGR
ncbi:IclR family transcriptional regulator [Streptomyces sp. NPDC004752]